MVRYDKIRRKSATHADRLAELSARHEKLQADYAKVKRALDSTLHEVRRFSGELSSYSEHLSKQLEAQHVDAAARELCETIFYTSGMISSRLAFTDLELNPAAVRLQVPLRSGIYKKFEKAGHVLSLKARLRHVTIQMKGSSFMEIEALPSFELLPFVLLDNAIKYSPPYQPITVRFDESGHGTRLEVCITSIGPYLDHDEKSIVLDHGKRGRNAEKSPITGDGLGLYLAQFLCGYHDLRLRIASDQSGIYDINGIPYAPFTVRLNAELTSS